MTNKLNEYKNKPALSMRASEFIKTHQGGLIPEDIRIELEKYISELTPIVDQNGKKMVQYFENVFKK